MKRLIVEGQGKNSSEEYNRIFFERQKKGVDWADMRRWKTLLKYFRGGSLLDAGCLDSMIYDLVKYEVQYYGIDTAVGAIEEMRERYKDSNVVFLVEDIYKTSFEDNQFDYAIMGEVIEHLNHPEKAISEAMRILKPGGVLALSTPLEEEKEIGAVDKDRHIWSFDEQDIRNLLKPYGKIKIKILRSRHFLVYKYCWPQIVAWCWKNER